MEPSFWSWEKHPWQPGPDTRASRRNGAQLLELGKEPNQLRTPGKLLMSQWSPAFGAGKSTRPSPLSESIMWSQWSPAFGAGKSRRYLHIPKELKLSQWSPAFGAGKRSGKPRGWRRSRSRNGAQLLELGKDAKRSEASTGAARRNGAQLLELGKVAGLIGARHDASSSQWSPAFGAGKRPPTNTICGEGRLVAMEPSFWSWEKSFLSAGKESGVPVAMEPSF